MERTELALFDVTGYIISEDGRENRKENLFKLFENCWILRDTVTNQDGDRFK